VEARLAKDTPAPELGDLRTRKSGDDWPSFLGPTHDSKSRETGLVTPWPKTGPKLVWQQQVATSYGPPAISQGRLFLFVREGNQAKLVCLRSETGEGLWEFGYPTEYEDMYGYDNGPRSGPVVDEDRVYAFGAEGMLHCVRAVDGALIWKCDTTNEFGVVQNFFGVSSAPLIENDLLIVPIGGSPPNSQSVPFADLKGNGSGIVAFDKHTGKIKYQTSDELASYASPVCATIGDRRWCFHFARGGLLGFRPDNGEIDFHYPWRAPILESVNASNPIVVGDEVLISETYGPGASLLKVRPGGYDIVWRDDPRRRDKSLQTHWNTPVHHDGFIYASSGRHANNAELRCVEWRTGEVRWSQPGLGRASLLYVDGHFVCVCEYGELLLLKANPDKFDLVSAAVLSGERTSAGSVDFGPTRLLEYPAWAAPVLSHGLLYVRGKDRLVCLELIPQAPPQ